MNKAILCISLFLLTIASFASAETHCPETTCSANNADDECACFGYDFGITKYDDETNTFEGGSKDSDYDISVTEGTNFDWTADPAVDGVLVKTGGSNNNFCEFAGGTSGSVSGTYSVSHITFCGNDPVCGDEKVTGDEECDDGSDNGVVCTPTACGICSYCSDTCEIETVRDYCPPPDGEVPEFSVVTLGLAVIGAGLGLVFIRKRD